MASGSRKPPPATPRRPPPLPPAGADAFVRGEPTSDRAPERPDVQAPHAPTPEAAPASTPAPAAPAGPDVQAPGHPSVQTTSAPTTRQKAIVTRADGVERRRLTVYLPPALAKRLAMYATGAEVEMSEVAADAIEAWLQTRGA